MSQVRPFVCPECRALLGRADGEFFQTYCRHCHAIKVAVPDEARELPRILRHASMGVFSGQGR